MPIQVDRPSSQFILRYRFFGHITYADLEALQIAEAPHFDALPEGGCHSIIADVTDLDTIDASLFPQLQRMRMVCDDRVCVVVMVGANPYVRVLAISLGLTAGKHGFIFRRTDDEAMDVLGALATV